jgi:hypothetical protein
MFVKIENNIVVQKQPYNEEGFIEVGDDVHCGMLYSKGKFVLPPRIITWDEKRGARNALLAQSDWTVLEDSPLSDDQKEKWKKYRQELRDITKKFKKPDDVVFPKEPE